MRKLLTLTAAAAFAVAFGVGGTAYADPNADTVTSSNLGAGCAPTCDISKAVDEVENTWVSLGTNGDITVRFDDNVLIPDGTGAVDLRIRDRCGGIEAG